MLCAAAGLVAKVIHSQAQRESMKETCDRSHSALLCIAHEIPSWTYLQSGNLRDRRQHRASCTQRSDKLGRPRSPFSGCPTHRKRRQCDATGELSKRQGGLLLSFLPTRGRHRGSRSRTLLPTRLFSESRAKCAARRQTKFFFPRVRTPCGHGAQVIVEGREEQSDGRKEQGQPTQPKTKQTTAHRPSLHHHVVFPLCQVKRVKRKQMTSNGPEFTNEKLVGAGLCSSKVSKKASKGLYFVITSDQRPHHSAAKPWSRCRSGVSQCSNAGCVHVKMEQRSYAACRGKDISCGTTRTTGCTYKSSGMLPGGDQSVAATANDESLQVRVRKGTSLRREVNSAPFGTQRCQKQGVSSRSVKCCVIAKSDQLRARPV